MNQNRRKMQSARCRPRLHGCSLPALLLLVCLGPISWGAGTGIVRSASELDYPPFAVVTPAGNAGGFSVELLRAALAAMGREVTFRVGPWGELKQDLAEGKLDVLPLVGRTPEREPVFDFTFPYLTMHGALFVRSGDSRMRVPGDLSDKEILVMKGDNAEEYAVRETLSSGLVSVDTYEEAFRRLAEGEHDAVLAQKLMGVNLLRRLGIDNVVVSGVPLHAFKQDFSFAVKEGDGELLALLNEGLSVVVSSGGLRRLKQKWLFPLGDGPPRDRVVTVGGDHNYPPYEFLDEAGHPTGYNVELTKAIAKVMGLEVHIRLGPWSEIRKALEDGEIDVLQGMCYSAGRDRVIDFSVPHHVLHHALFARADSPDCASLADLPGHRVAVIRGDIMHDFAVEQGLHETLLLAETPEEAMQALNEGKADFALCARFPGLYWVKERGWDEIRILDPHVNCPDYCYAVRDGDVRLLSVLEEGMALLKQTGEYRRIREQWLGVLEPTGVPWPRILKIGGAALAAVLAVLALVCGWSISLRQQVTRKTRELEAAVSEQRQQACRQAALLEAVPLPVFYKDCEGRYTGCNRAFETIIGRPRDQIVGMTVHDIAPKEIADEYFKKDRELLDNPGSQTYEWTVKPLVGDERHVIFSKATFEGTQGNVVGLVGAILDITELRRNEAALRESEELHRVLFESSRDAIMTLEPPSWGFTSGNPACVEMFRCADETDFTTRGPWDLSPETQPDGLPSADKAGEMIAQAMERGSNFFEWAHRRADGEVFPATVLLTRVELHDRTFLQATVRDISDQERAEEAVKRAAEDWRNTFDAIDDPVAIIDRNHTVIRANRAMRALSPGQDVVGTQCHALIHGMQQPHDGCVACGAFEDGCPAHVELQEPHLDNRWFDVSAFPVKDGAGTVTHVVHVMRDITERHQAEAREKELDGRLRRQQRLAAVGTLARGIAHEINNPLMGMVNYAELIEDEEGNEAEAREFAAEIIAEGQRVAKIVRTLLVFSVQDEQSQSPAAGMADIVNSALKPLRSALEKDHSQLVIDVPDTLPHIHCRNQQIQHVLTNLLTNAQEALNERYPGSDPDKVIIITASELEKSGRHWLRTTVEDHGAGIPAEACERLFEPFFTTKDRSHSAGLGLAIAHWIVEDHQGELTVETEPGEYTRFHMDLALDSA